MKSIPIESKAYTKWEDYIKSHPEIADLKEAEVLHKYEDDFFNFIISNLG